MNSLELVDSFSEFKEFKNIDRVTMMNILEDVFRSVIIRKYGDDSNYDIIINPDKGDLEMWRNREIVYDGEVEDDFGAADAAAGGEELGGREKRESRDNSKKKLK